MRAVCIATTEGGRRIAWQDGKKLRRGRGRCCRSSKEKECALVLWSRCAVACQPLLVSLFPFPLWVRSPSPPRWRDDYQTNAELGFL
jgi:hypothetical protein